MARLLQQQLDMEDDNKLRIEEKKYNGNNKGKNALYIYIIL